VYGTKACLFTKPAPSLPNARGTILAATAAAAGGRATVSMLMERDVKQSVLTATADPLRTVSSM